VNVEANYQEQNFNTPLPPTAAGFFDADPAFFLPAGPATIPARKATHTADGS